MRLRLVTAVITLHAAAAPLTIAIHEQHSHLPVRSAQLVIEQPGALYLTADIESDTAGKFQPVDLAPGEYDITISKPNYLPSKMRVHAAGAPIALQLALVKCAVIAGAVQDAEGHPIPDATVVAIAGTNRNDPTVAHTDAGGSYRISFLKPGIYTVAAGWGASRWRIGSTGMPPATAPAGTVVAICPEQLRVLGGEDYHGIDFVAPPGPRFDIAGRVHAPSDNGSYWVTLTPADRPEFAAAVAIADDKRAFHFTGISAGAYLVLAFGPVTARAGGAILGSKAIFGRSQVLVGGAGPQQLDIPTSPGKTLTVRLDSDPGCPSETAFSLTPLEDWAMETRPSHSVKAGTPAAVPSLAPAPYRVAARQSGACYQNGSGTIDLSRADNPAFTIKLSRGAVLNVHAAPNTLVTLTGAASNAIALTNGDGHAEFKSLPPGQYWLTAGDRSTNGKPIQLQAGATRAVDLSKEETQ